MPIAPDKKKHFIVGIALGFVLQVAAAYVFKYSPWWAFGTSFFILTAMCYGLELFSYVTGKGTADNMDAIAGILGGLIGIGAAYIIT